MCDLINFKVSDYYIEHLDNGIESPHPSFFDKIFYSNNVERCFILQSYNPL